ncbi:MAG: kelch repeat-containing protein [Deltaproteobacteria bacterium]|nr:kelch repeat-containing protein [Deltaproteobacteria bacterium]
MIASRRSHLLAALLALLAPLPAAAQAALEWSDLPNAPFSVSNTARSFTATGLADGRVMIFGPTPGLLDPDTGEWTLLSPTYRRWNHDAILLPDGRVLLTGGMETGSGAWLNTDELWAPEDGSWSLATGWRPRVDSATVLLNDGRALAVGGKYGIGAAQSPIASSALFDPGTDSWSGSLPLETARQWHGLTRLLDGRVLVAGGYTSSDAWGEVFDPATELWSRSAEGPTAILSASSAILLADGRALLPSQDPPLIYDPVAETMTGAGVPDMAPSHATVLLPDDRVLDLWRSGAALGSQTAEELYTLDEATWSWVSLGPKPWTATIQVPVLLPDGRVLLLGPDPVPARLRAALLTARVGDATSGGALPAAVEGAVALRLPDGRALLVGGRGAGAAATDASFVQEADGSWSHLGSLVQARDRHAASLTFDGSALVTGGRDAGGALASVERLTAGGAVWSGVSPLAVAREAHAQVTLPDRSVLVAGGQGAGGAALSSTERYDAASDLWTASGAQGSARYRHTLTLLRDGRVLAVGGLDDVGHLRSTELYDPATGTWSPAGDLAAPRARHAALLLVTGEVLVVGGTDASSPLATAELFDPVTATWSSAGTMSSARVDHAAALLPDGRVLVAGGFDGTTTLADAEVWSPAEKAWTATAALGGARSRAVAIPGRRSGIELLGGLDASGLPLAGTLHLSDFPGRTSGRRPTPTLAAAGVIGGDLILEGTGLRGAHPGAGAAPGVFSGNDHPVVSLMGPGVGRRFLLTRSEGATRAVASLPADLLPGWYEARVHVGGIASEVLLVRVNDRSDEPLALGFTSAPHALVAGSCSPAITFEVRDATGPTTLVEALVVIPESDQPSETGLFADAACTQPLSQLELAAGATGGTFHVRATTAGDLRLRLYAPGLRGAEQTHAVAPALPSALRFVGLPATSPVGSCAGPVELRTEDANGNASLLAADTVLSLSATPAGAVLFYADPGCTAALGSSLTILEARDRTTLYLVGQTEVTVDLAAAAAGFTPASGQVSVLSSDIPVALGMVSPPRSVVAGTCSPAVTVRAETFDGRNPTVGADLPLAITADSPTLALFADAACTVPLSAPAITAGSVSLDLHFLDVVAGSPTLSFAAAGLAPTAQQQTVTPAAAARLVFVALQSTTEAGTPLGFALEARDAYENVVPTYAGTVTFSVSGDPLASLPGDETFTGVEGGSALIGDQGDPLILRTAGTQVVEASDGSITGQQSVLVNPAPAHRVAITGAASADVLQLVPLGLQLVDAFGNDRPEVLPLTVEVRDSTAVVIASTTLDGAIPPGRTLAGDTDASGGARVDVLSTAATSARVCAGGTLPGGETCHALLFGSDAADHVALLPDATSTAAGTTLGVELRLLDFLGNAVAVDATLELAVDGEAHFVSSGTATETVSVTAGAARVELSGERAETVTVTVVTAVDPGGALPEVVPHESAELTFVPAAASGVLLAADDGLAEACESETITIQVVDAFGNAAPEVATLRMGVRAASGAPVILVTSLAGASAGGSEVTGDTDASGQATLTVSLDTADALEVLRLTGGSLPADPTTEPVLGVSFGVGAADPMASTLQASGSEVFAGSGQVTLTVAPHDDCGVSLGRGQLVELFASYGALEPVVDLGDGTYQAAFRTAVGECPAAAAEITARVNGVVLSGSASIDATCLPLDPGSAVTVETTGVRACASQGEWARLHVDPRDQGGAPLPAGQEVTVDVSPPHLVAGAVRELTGPGGAPLYEVEVGSERCGVQAVPLRVGGVLLDEQPLVDFACPAVDPAAITLVATPSSLAADGSTRAELVLGALDVCGNPAFDRSASLAVREGSPPVSLGASAAVLASAGRTGDDLGGSEDGVARWEVSSPAAGVAGFEARVDGVGYLAPSLVTFTLPPEAVLRTFAFDREVAVVGDAVLLEAQLESAYGAELDGLTVTPVWSGLEVKAVRGASHEADGSFLVGELPAGETLSFEVELRVVGQEAVGVELSTSWREPVTNETDSASEARLPLPVEARHYYDYRGCGCESDRASHPGLALLLGLLLLARRRQGSSPSR